MDKNDNEEGLTMAVYNATCLSEEDIRKDWGIKEEEVVPCIPGIGDVYLSNITKISSRKVTKLVKEIVNDAVKHKCRAVIVYYGNPFAYGLFQKEFEAVGIHVSATNQWCGKL